MRRVIYLAVIMAAGMSACKGSKITPPEDPTNEDAIYNIIRYDRQLEFNLDLHDTTVPDTTSLIAAPYQPLHFWRKINADSLFIGIEINEVEEGDTIGAVPWAEVNVIKTFWGSLEIIATDTSGGGSERVRMSKPFTMAGQIDAVFEKVGFDYNTRRGWILTRISDAIFSSVNMPWEGMIGGIEIRGEDGPPIVVNPNLKLTRDVPTFSPGESLTVYFRVLRADNHVSIRYAAGADYETRQPARLDSLTYYQGFRLPAYVEFNHFMIDWISNDAVADTFSYYPASHGVLYRVR